MTTALDLQTPTPTLDLRGFVPPTLRLHPVVDHIADKLCATQSTYGAARDRPSSRVRDLVDLVVFARSQDVDGDAPINAIRAKWNHQGLAGDRCSTPSALGAAVPTGGQDRAQVRARFTRPRIREPNVRVVEDTFGVRSQSARSS